MWEEGGNRPHPVGKATWHIGMDAPSDVTPATSRGPARASPCAQKAFRTADAVPLDAGSRPA